MTLGHRLLQRNVRRPRVLVFDGTQKQIRKIVVGLKVQRSLKIRSTRPERMRRNFHALPTTEFSDSICHPRFIEFEYKPDLFLIRNDVIAVRGCADSWFVE